MSMLGSLFGGGQPQMTPPPPPAAPQPAPTLNAPQVGAAAQQARRRAIGASGGAGTVVTGPMGLTQMATTAPKSLLSGAA